MRVCVTAIVLRVALPGLADAQSGMDASPFILVHPDVLTLLHLPDDIERAQLRHGGEMEVSGIGRTLHVRPRPGTPAGLEALLEVKTRSVHRIFILQVVERPEQAMHDVVVPATAAAHAVEDAPSGTPAGAADAAPEATDEQREEERFAPEAATPLSENTAERDAESSPERAGPDADAARYALSVHALVAPLGVTALHVPGYAPNPGWRPHRALGLRIAIVPHDTWWAVEANMRGQWLDAPTLHVRELGDIRRQEREVRGSWLSADVGARARAGTRWMPTAHASLGGQTHLGKTENFLREGQSRELQDSTKDMRFGMVLTLGAGLHYQSRDVLLGLDFQLRQAVPAGYRSLDVLLAVGFFLDRGE